jgi:hypothetical protein
MPKETCPNCATKMSEPVSFCPTCDRPTRHANDAERLDWDLKQWRTHVGKSAAAGPLSDDAVRGSRGGVIVASAEKPVPPVARPAAVVLRPDAPVQPRRTVARRPSRIDAAKQRLARRKDRKEPPVVIDLDADNAFAYRACATCQATDWIIRTNRNDDGTWNYWCVRCSRTFKTENKLHQAVKPFASAGAVVGGLIAASILILH